MGSFPWGPHGPEVSPLQVKPNPTAASPAPAFEQPDYSVAQSTGGGGAGGPWVSFVASLIMVPFVWMFWICLYPMTAVAGIGAGMLSVPLFARMLSAGEDPNVAAGFGVIVAFAVMVVVSRIEYRLAQGAAFRLGRHVLRLILFGVFAVPWLVGFMGDASVRTASFRYIAALLSHPSYLLRQMTNPQNLLIVVAVMVGVHFLLWKADRLRAFWHRRLMWLGLK